MTATQSPGSIIQEMAFSGYPVTDMARARRFYETLFGLSPDMVVDEGDSGWVEYNLGNITLALGKHQGWEPNAQGPSVALELNDFDATISNLKSQSVIFTSEPFDTPVCRMAIILDSEGNSVILHKRKPEHH